MNMANDDDQGFKLSEDIGVNGGVASGTPTTGAASETTPVAETVEPAKKGGLFDWFKVSQKSADEKVAKITEQMAGKEGEELVKLENQLAKAKESVGKLHWGKTALVALPVAAVIGMALAGTGNKGPGENAAKVRDEQAAAAQQKDAAPGVA